MESVIVKMTAKKQISLQDIFNSRNKGNRKLAKECMQKLEDCGFLVIDSTLDTKGTSNYDLFLK